jgi:nucleotide-binding universal stress UspA family protein
MSPDGGQVVVPLDGSRIAENAVPWAARIGRLYGIRVEFVHVLDPDAPEAPGDLDAISEGFRTYARDLAEQHGVGDHGAAFLKGPAAPAILEFAADARFIVLATHGRGGFRAAFIGSVADKVVRGAEVPVLLVPGVGGPVSPDNRPMVIALDGSPQAEAGLQTGRDLAAKMGAQVVLIRAWSLPPAGGAPFYYYDYFPPQLIDTLEGAANEYLAGVARKGERTMVVQGPAAPVIRDTATELDASLVVVTSSGKGLAARITLGSTTDRLAHSLHRPLLIVPVAG